MKTKHAIYLPGTDQQMFSFLNHFDVKEKKLLIIGGGTDEIARIFYADGAETIIIVEDHENLLLLRNLLSDSKSISVRMMDFENTDFKDAAFDFVYAQASISSSKRNKIVKEIKRILKPGGIFCVGEIVNLSADDVPQFVIDIWEQSDIVPLASYKFSDYYKEKNFEVLFEKDLSETLKDFYSLSSSRLKEKISNLSDREISYYKKLLKQISHESNAYLRLGANKFIGFKILTARKA